MNHKHNTRILNEAGVCGCSSSADVREGSLLQVTDLQSQLSGLVDVFLKTSLAVFLRVTVLFATKQQDKHGLLPVSLQKVHLIVFFSANRN